MFAKGKEANCYSRQQRALRSDAEAIDVFVSSFCRQRTAHAERQAKRLGYEGALSEHAFSQRTPHIRYRGIPLEYLLRVGPEAAAGYTDVIGGLERTFCWLRQEQENRYNKLAKGAQYEDDIAA